MVKETSCGGVTMLAPRRTVTMACALSPGPTDAIDEMRAVWAIMKPVSCHFSRPTRAQKKKATFRAWHSNSCILLP